MPGVEVPELLPREVRDAQRGAARHGRVRVVGEQLVLQVLCEDPLAVCLRTREVHTVTRRAHGDTPPTLGSGLLPPRKGAVPTAHEDVHAGAA